MAERTLTDAGIWISGYDLAGVSNSVALNASVNLLDRSTFADKGWTKRAAGLKTSSFALSGFFDTDGPDEEQFNSLGEERSVLVVPAEMTPGAVAYVVPVAVSAHETAGSIGELVTFSYAAEGDGKPSRAQVVDIRDGVTADVITPRLDVGAVSAAQTLRAWVHVMRIAGSLDLALRSANAQTGGATTSRATRNGITATGLYELTFTGTTTNRWWLLDLNVSGAADFGIAAAVAIL